MYKHTCLRLYFCLQCRDSVDTHYDPTRKDHAKFEEEIKRPESPVQNNEDNVTEEVPAANEHVATQEKFYSVSDSLKEFFTNKDKVCQNLGTGQKYGRII